MQVCYVLDSDPDRYNGGTPNVVRNIRRYVGGHTVSGSRSAVKNIILMLAAPLRVAASGCDVVNIHDTHGYFCTFRPFMKKTVYTCHGLWKNYYRISPPRTAADKIKSRMAMFFQGRILKKADRIIAVSNSVKGQITQEYHIEPEKISVIHNGVDTEVFSPGKRGIGFIWVGDNPSLKGLDGAISYARKHKGMITIVGVEGQDSEGVKYLGSVKHENMADVYRTAGTLLFFSKFEGHPLVPMEAAACGLNIIASIESNLEIFPTKKGIYSVKGKDAITIAKKHDWKNQAKLYSDIFLEAAMK